MERDAFVELGLAPTLDLAQIKRAYFEALKRSPPHVDPAGFRRVRRAYESLLEAGGRAEAFVNAPVDLQAERARFRKEWGDRLEQERHRVASSQREAQRGERFVELASRMGLAEACARFGRVS